MKCFSGVVALLLANLIPAECRSGYVFVSSPNDKTIYYSPLLSAADQSKNTAMSLKTLSRNKVERPMGIAVDSSRGILYVADPGTSSVVGFRVFEDNDEAGRLASNPPVKVMSNITAHWIAVNSVGALFASDPKEGRIWTMSAENLRKVLDGDYVKPAEQLYTFEDSVPIRKPQGLATDGSRLFWANGQDGKEVGSVVQGVEEIGSSLAAETTRPLNKETEAAFGVCLTSSRIFYTNREHSVYTMRADGTGRRVSVTNQLQEPRGCAYDGDGTVFVADRKLGKVFSFPGGSQQLAGERSMSPVLEVGDAYGVAVLAQNFATRAASLGLVAALATSLMVLVY